MCEPRICRICFDSNVQMYPIWGSEVQNVYEKLTETQVLDAGAMFSLCYLCYWQLRKCQQLVIKSQKTEELLKQILVMHNELNLKSVHSVDRLSHGLVNSLMISNTVSLQIPECHEMIKSEDQRESDTDEVMFKDEPEDEWTHTNEKLRDEKQNIIQDKEKCRGNISDTQKNTFSEENESSKIVCSGMGKQVLVNDNKNSFVCNDSGKVFDKKALIIKHISRHDCMIMNPEDKCVKKKSYVRKFELKECDSLKERIPTHKGENTFKCKYCNHTSKSTYMLDKHIRTHALEKPFKCTYCNHTFSTSSNLMQHIKTHTGEKPFKCKYCNYTCITSSKLKCHIRKHTGEDTFKCEYCSHTFLTSSNLKTHIRTHTGEKPFKCEYCKYTSTTNSNLKRHIRAHTGEKPYKCEYCNYICGDKSKLKCHIRKHTGEEPFKCEYCNHTCSTSSSLKKHIRTHTGE